MARRFPEAPAAASSRDLTARADFAHLYYPVLLFSVSPQAGTCAQTGPRGDGNTKLFTKTPPGARRAPAPVGPAVPGRPGPPSPAGPRYLGVHAGGRHAS